MNSAESENSKNVDKKQMPPEDESAGERLQKLMAKAGLGSRRACEELIAEGRVSVNGHIITQLGTRADLSRDRVVVDGKPLTLPSGPSVVVMLHKPRGVITTRNDPENRATVMELLPRKWENLHPIGRLDFDTSGLLLLTDDGELTQLLTHPSHGVEKTYQARVRGQVKAATVRLLQDGVRLEDGMTAPCRVRVRAQTQNNALVEITLREGRNRQVRRMLEAVGHQVSVLRRIKFGPIEIEGVAIGTYRQLLPGEVHMLRKAATTKTKVAKAKNLAPRARKLSPASPISAAERARRKEVVRSARAAKSTARPYTRRESPEAEIPEIDAPKRSTTPRSTPNRASSSRPTNVRSTTPRPDNARSANSRSASERPASARPGNARPTNSRPSNNRASSGDSRDTRPTANRSYGGNNSRVNNSSSAINARKAPDSRGENPRNENASNDAGKSAVARRIQKRWQ